MSTPPAGFLPDPKDPRFFYDPNGDPNADSSWYEQPPDGFEYDTNPKNAGWAFRTGGDTNNNDDWWKNWTVKDVPTSTIPDWAIVNGLVHSVDFSNYQPQAQTPEGLEALLAQVSPRPWHIIVRLSHESAAMKAIAVNQLQTAVAGGYGTGGYGWSYGPISPSYRQDDPRGAVHAFLDDVAKAGTGRVPVLWFDAEGQTDLPTVDWMLTAFDEAIAQSQRPGIYSNPSWLQPHFGNTDAFAGQPMWNANYNGRQDLNVPTWGGMVVVGHQFTSSPFDRSVFLPEYVA